MGRPLTPKALHELGPLNRLLERDEAFSQISRHRHSDGDRLELQMMRRWRSPEFLLLPIGEALAQFVCEEDFADVKACEGHKCTLVFADRTRRRARRWCSMAICGESRQTGRAPQSAQEETLTKLTYPSLRSRHARRPLPTHIRSPGNWLAASPKRRMSFGACHTGKSCLVMMSEPTEGNRS